MRIKTLSAVKAVKHFWLAVGIGLAAFSAWAGPTALAPACPAGLPGMAATPTNSPIAWSDLGAKATAQYSGDGLAIAVTPSGAVRLRCAFQKLEGEVTREGLWLESTVPGGAMASGAATVPARRFRVMADAVGREGGTMTALPRSGTASGDTSRARFVRPGLVEEYSVSVDGVRQDFVVSQPPAGPSDLYVELALSGARAEVVAGGAQLVLEGSGRKLAYSRLRVVDATGRPLAARIEVPAPDRLAVVVVDANAAYPVRIDPTFSDADWTSLGGRVGASSSCNAAIVDSAGNVYVGGVFSSIGTLALPKGVAKWDGTTWSAIGAGMNGNVLALELSGTDLYAGGSFLYATNTDGTPVLVNRIAKWDGTTWSALGLGADQDVKALAVSETNVFAGGIFTNVVNTVGGAVPANRVAKWDGTTWSALGAGVERLTIGTGAGVLALAVVGTDLYAGGRFAYATNTSGPAPVYNLARWDGTNWSALGAGLNGSVFALVVSETNLYAGGDFTYATNVTVTATNVNRVAKWNLTTSSWSALGAGMSYQVTALAVSGTNLYAGGDFTYATNGTATPVSANRIAQWDGSAWSGLGTGINSSVFALAVSGTNLYAMGGFTGAGGMTANSIARWNGSTWWNLGGGALNVYAMAVSGTDLYAGGAFSSAGGLSTASCIAKWDGSGWSALAGGVNSNVRALAVIGTDLYAGGDFIRATNAGGFATNASRVAKWDGTNWSALGGGGSSGPVYALAVSGTDLYVGGAFTSATNAGGFATNAFHLAKWDGANWSTPAGGLSGNVRALAVSETDLYVGGDFTSVTNGVEALPASRLAKLSLTPGVWSAYGGLNSTVHALALAGSTLYAGGAFTAATNGASSTNAYRIAGLNLTTGGWTDLGGGGSSGPVYALAVSGADLFVGGDLSSVTNAESSPLTASNIAKWDGTTWSALGSGANSTVRALAASGTNLYVGGEFTSAGGKVASSVAKALIPESKLATTNTLVASLNPSTCGASVTFTSTVSPSAATGTVTFKDGAAVLGTGTLSAGMATFVTNGLPAGSHSLTAEYAGDASYAASSSEVLTQTVNKLIPSVTWPTASAITYGQTLASSTLTGGASTPEGSFAFTTPATAPGAGTASQPVTFTPTDTTNYASISGVANVTVNPLPAVLTGSRLYDGTADAAASILTVSNALAGDTVTVTSGPATLAAALPGVQAITSMGTLALGGARGTNYTLTGASGSVTITSAPPSIIVQPAGGVVAIGQSNGVSVTVTGTLPGYQWFKDNVRLSGQTNRSVSFASFQFTDSGSYRVVVTNSLGMVLSRPALLSVPNAPLQAWGANGNGQLGNGSPDGTNQPVSMTSNVVAVAAGYAHSLLVKADGTLWAMGGNSYGQLGNGSNSDTNQPVSVASNVVAVAAGGLHSLLVKADGTLWAMGDNFYGQLGNGSNNDTNRPVSLASNVVAVAAGGYHSLFVKADGTLWAMGMNSSGQLGDGSNSDTNQPVSVASNVVAVAVGNEYALFVKADGTLWGMGNNDNGQLGNGSNSATNRPVSVASEAAPIRRTQVTKDVDEQNAYD